MRGEYMRKNYFFYGNEIFFILKTLELFPKKKILTPLLDYKYFSLIYYTLGSVNQ